MSEILFLMWILGIPVCDMSEFSLFSRFCYIPSCDMSKIYFLSVWNSDCEQTLSMKRLLEEVGEGNRPSSKRGWKEQDKQGEINIIDFDNDDEYAPNVGPSPKATRADDMGVQVHFWDD